MEFLFLVVVVLKREEDAPDEAIETHRIVRRVRRRRRRTRAYLAVKSARPPARPPDG